VSETLDREVKAGLPHLGGTDVAGSITLTEAAINDLIVRARGSTDVAIRIHSDNRLVVHYGALFGTVHLGEQVDVRPSPTVRLTLASKLFAIGLRFAPKLRNITVAGSEIRIDLGGFVPPAYRGVLRHVEEARLKTTSGTLHVTFRVRVI
jgi:hypothetical protein